MATDGHPSPDELYRQGLLHFRKGEWQPAVDAWSELEATGKLDRDGEQLLADARLRLQFASVDQPEALPPPRSPIWPRLAGIVALLLIVFAGYQAYSLVTAAPVDADFSRGAAAVETATAEPTALVADAVITPTAALVGAPAVTETQAISATVVITASDTFFNTPDNLAIIVDASGSMLAEIPGTGRQRWQVAQDALRTLVTSGAIEEDAQVAVRTYGRQKSNDCSDIELMQPLSRFSPTGLQRLIDTIKPVVNGRTPLAASLRAAADDLLAAEGSTVIILVTDGLESCGGDTVAEAANLVGASDQRKLHVIGFAVDDPAANASLRSVAETGRGLYFDADNSVQLAEALRQAVVLTYQIVTPEGAEVATGTVGQAPVQLPAGSYRLRINATPPIEQDLVIGPGSTVEVVIRQGFGGLLADPRVVSP